MERSVSSRLIDYQTKKSVHINLTKSTHSGLRISLIKRGLSMQEVFNRLASMICEQHPSMIRVLDSIEIEKREGQIKQVTRSDAESIFDLIETSNPFAEDKKDLETDEEFPEKDVT